MRGSNPRPLAHKTNTLPTELMEPVCLNFAPTKAHNDRMRVRGLVVMIVACQVMDPGSIPGERIFLVTGNQVTRVSIPSDRILANQGDWSSGMILA